MSGIIEGKYMSSLARHESERDRETEGDRDEDERGDPDDTNESLPLSFSFHPKPVVDGPGTASHSLISLSDPEFDIPCFAASTPPLMDPIDD